MTALVVDASIAVKWIIDEPDSADALSLLGRFRFRAPDLLMAEAANVLWKKVRLGEFDAEEARDNAAVLARAEIELFPMRDLMVEATRLSILLRHPAYDCFYLALALSSGCRFVTGAARFLGKLAERPEPALKGACISLKDAVEMDW